MRDFSKTPGNRRNLVRQIKGPGMNLGLKKRHKLGKAKLKGWNMSPKDDKPNMKQGPMYSTLFQPVQTKDYSKPGGKRRKTRSSTKVKIGGFF